MPGALPSLVRSGPRRPAVAGPLLLLVYAALSLAMNPDGHLGTDTGAKVATLESMAQRGTLDPDVGYWAEDHDPDGALHPLYQAAPLEDGGWVAVTTLPVLLAAAPLYELGGYRATLVLPMLGTVGVAFAARALARRLGATDGGWAVFWVVGLASPLVVYALDFWEHSIGVACVVAAIALLLDVADGRTFPHAPAAGALLGAAAILRNEALVYALVGVAMALATRWWRERRVLDGLWAGALTVAGFAGPWLANVALERLVAAPGRGERAASSAAGIGVDLGTRAREALQTSIGLNAGDAATAAVTGAAVLAVLVVGLRAAGRGDDRFALACVVAAGVVFAIDAVGGLGFVPGLFVAFPITVAVLVHRPDAATRLATGIGIAALPLVYLAQYSGGAAPQWGGRYTLTSSILLGVVALVTLRERQPAMARRLSALSLGVTIIGVAWLGVRSHGVASFFDSVIERSEPVVISRNAFLIREGGDAVVGRRWLSVADEASFTDAIEVARRVGEPRFSVLEWGADAPPERSLPSDVIEVRRARLTFVDVPVGLVTYAFADRR